MREHKHIAVESIQTQAQSERNQKEQKKCGEEVRLNYLKKNK